MDAEPFHFARSARSPRAIAVLLLWWGVIALLYFALDASAVICMVLALFSAPALFDLGANAQAGLKIDDTEIAWRTGRRGGNLPRAQLKSVRLDTRLDLSLRMTLITHPGDKVRLPYECVPKADIIARALDAQDIPFERHHFTLLS